MLLYTGSLFSAGPNIAELAASSRCHCDIDHSTKYSLGLKNALLNESRFLTLGSVHLTQYCAGGEIEKNEMGRVCGAYGRGERCAQASGGETRRKETTGETQT